MRCRPARASGAGPRATDGGAGCRAVIGADRRRCGLQLYIQIHSNFWVRLRVGSYMYVETS